MGGGDSSSSASTSSNSTAIDKRMVVDSGVGVSSDSSTVNITSTDMGAVKSAFDFAGASGRSALEFAGESGERMVDSFDRVLKLADTVLSGSLTANDKSASLMAQAFETAKTTASGSIDQKTMMVLAGVAAVALVVIKRKAA